MTGQPEHVYFANCGRVFVWHSGLMTRRQYKQTFGRDIHSIAKYDRPLFDPRRPYGPVVDELGRRCLNLGAWGMALLMIHKEEITDREIDKLLENDRDAFWQWAAQLEHLHKRTVPGTAERRALLTLEWERNGSIYALVGIPAPAF